MTSVVRVIPVAPSSPFDALELERGLSTLRSLGFDVEYRLPPKKANLSYLNGFDDERLFELQAAFEQAESQIIWAIRGGYGLARILPKLDVSHNRHIVIGFSDTSALLMYLWKQLRMHSIHGPGICKMPSEPPEVVEALQQILQGQAKQVRYPSFGKLNSCESHLEGTLLAANLCVLAHLIGTPVMPNLDGSILILEEVNEYPYRIDAMLTQLADSGSLSGVRAIIVGHLTGCVDTKSPTTALEVFQERCTYLGIPLFGQIKVGHEAPNFPIPIGVQCEIVHDDDNYSLKILSEMIS